MLHVAMTIKGLFYSILKLLCLSPPLSCNSDALLALLFCPEQPQQCPQELLKSLLSMSSLIPLNFTNKP